MCDVVATRNGSCHLSGSRGTRTSMMLDRSRYVAKDASPLLERCRRQLRTGPLGPIRLLDRMAAIRRAALDDLRRATRRWLGTLQRVAVAPAATVAIAAIWLARAVSRRHASIAVCALDRTPTATCRCTFLPMPAPYWVWWTGRLQMSRNGTHARARASRRSRCGDNACCRQGGSRLGVGARESRRHARSSGTARQNARPERLSHGRDRDAQSGGFLKVYLATAVAALKREEGKDLLAIGTPMLVQMMLFAHDLVDELRLMIDPVNPWRRQALLSR
jgi:RibD domain-containing protein